jgi:protoheme IX farnesyltransferase
MRHSEPGASALHPRTTSLQSLWAYIEVTKPPSVILLVATAWTGIIVAARGGDIPMGVMVVALAAAVAGCAGANTLTCYIDRDIDLRMSRTNRRPIPAGRIHPPERALLWGGLLTLLSFCLAWALNPLAFLLALAGFLDNVVVYSLLTKRRSRFNILWGSFSGGIPALFGWAAVQNSLDWTPVLIAAIVVLWTPNHIWNLAIFHSEDYRRVKVPMLPAVYDLNKTLRCIAATVFLMYGASMLLGFTGHFGLIYILTAAIAGFLMVVGNLYMILRPSARLSWTLFKISSPYLLVLFASMSLDAILLG